MEHVRVKPVSGGLTRVLLVAAALCLVAGFTPLFLHGLALPKDPWTLAAALACAGLLVLWAYQNDSRSLELQGSQLEFRSVLYGWNCNVAELSSISSEVDLSGSIKTITFWRGAEQAMKLRSGEWKQAELNELLRTLQLLNPAADMSLAILLHLESLYTSSEQFE